jgi:hypothetical protein
MGIRKGKGKVREGEEKKVSDNWTRWEEGRAGRSNEEAMAQAVR